MKVAVVTGYVQIPGFPRSPDEYERLGARLRELRAAPVRVFRCELEDCWLYEHVHKKDVAHAVADNPAKNTLAYHVVQHQKSAWLVKAAEANPEADVLVWLDYGIFHLPDVTVGAVDDFLRRIRPDPEVVIPGCWERSGNSTDWPDWRFCGGTLVVHRTLAQGFHDAVQEVTLERIARERRVTWEVNDWAEVEKRQRFPIRWYAADHNKTLFTNYAPRASV